MRSFIVLVLWLVGGLVTGILIWYLPPKMFPHYTARTFIRVLPASQNVSNQMDVYTVSAAALIKSQNTLESLVKSAEIQQTAWFGRLGATLDERMTNALAELKRHLNAETLLTGDLVAVSFISRDSQDAAIVLNEIVDLFLKRQDAAERKRIATALSRLEEQQIRIQRDLDQGERNLDEVRTRYGFSDLEQQSYPDPITTRLIDLQRQEDDYAVEIKRLQIQKDELTARPGNTADELNALQSRLKLAQGDLAEIQKMKVEAQKQYEELNLAREQYEKRLAIRDERRQVLDSVKSRIEELRILHEAPDAGGMQFVESAEVPRQAEMSPWQTIIPITTIAAIIAGIIQLLLAGRAREKILT